MSPESKHEYKVVPAPMKGMKAKGVKGTPARFAHALEVLMNEMAQDGWEYQRTDTLPVEERQGLTGKTTTFQNMLVFRRTIVAPVEEATPAALIEDQSDAAPQEVAADPEQVEDAQVDDTQDEEAAADSDAAETKERVDQTLKSDGLSMPWSRKTNTARTDQDETSLPAE